MNISMLVLFYYVYLSMAWICNLCIQYTYCVDADKCTCMTSIYDCTAAHMHSLVVHTVCACCMYYMHSIPSISLPPIL